MATRGPSNNHRSRGISLRQLEGRQPLAEGLCLLSTATFGAAAAQGTAVCCLAQGGRRGPGHLSDVRPLGFTIQEAGAAGTPPRPHPLLLPWVLSCFCLGCRRALRGLATPQARGQPWVLSVPFEACRGLSGQWGLWPRGITSLNWPYSHM